MRRCGWRGGMGMVKLLSGEVVESLNWAIGAVAVLAIKLVRRR
jgi:hypothetical protein